jgi:hypothetical protein
MSQNLLQAHARAQRTFRFVRSSKVANGFTVSIFEGVDGSYSWVSEVVKRGRQYTAQSAQTFDTATAAEVAAVSALRNASK